MLNKSWSSGVAYSRELFHGLPRTDYKGSREYVPPTPDFEAAKETIRKILSDGQWHKRADLQQALGKYKVTLNAIIGELCVAESDTQGATKWLCIPDDRTPMYSPGYKGKRE